MFRRQRVRLWSLLACAAAARAAGGPTFTERLEFGDAFSLSVAWSDYDNDGDYDLAVANQPQGINGQGSELYINNGDGTFTGTDQFGSFPTMALAWGDYNNDGRPDVAVANNGNGQNYLYVQNANGTFTQQPQFGNGPAIGLAWGDFDLDGDLDLAVGRGILGNNQQNRLYVNNSNGTFTERSEFGGLQTDTVVWGDFDNDGDLDLAVGNGGFNSLQQNALYVNNGDGTFTERSEFGTGDTAAMAWGDADNDGDLDLAVANWENSDSLLYTNNGDGTFTGQLQFGTLDTNTVAWGDFDNDGDLDICAGNGDFGSADQNYLYINNGDGTWTEQAQFGLGSTDGMAWADFDADGDLDLAAGNEHSTGQNYLYINNFSGGEWLSMHLVGHFHDHGSGHSNRDAVGAKVSVYEAGHLGDPAFRLGYRELCAHGGFASQNPVDPHFGLPGQATVDVRIVWPGSNGSHLTTDLADVATGQRLVVDEAPSITNVEEVIADSSGLKTRALSFTVPPPSTATGSGTQRALRVTLVDLQHPAPRNLAAFPPPDFTAFDTEADGVCVGGQYAGHHCHADLDCAGAPAGTCLIGAGCTAAGELNGCARWVGPPQIYLESNDLPDRGGFRAARLQCTPFYHAWSDEGLMHVVGNELVPSSSYTIEVLTSECKGIEESCDTVSDPVAMATRRAGDVVAPFQDPALAISQPDALDITALVNKFRSRPGAPGKPAAQLQPDAPDPGGDVNALDINAAVNHFRFRAYPYAGPCPCPPLVQCGAPCSNPGQCPGGAAVASCVRVCDGGPHDGRPCINNKNCGLCISGAHVGLPCAVDGDCGGGACNAAPCPSTGDCRDRCGRCSP